MSNGQYPKAQKQFKNGRRTDKEKEAVVIVMRRATATLVREVLNSNKRWLLACGGRMFGRRMGRAKRGEGK